MAIKASVHAEQNRECLQGTSATPQLLTSSLDVDVDAYEGNDVDESCALCVVAVSDDEYDEDILCTLLETDDRQFDEGCKINEKWIVTCFMYTCVYILYIIRQSVLL